MSGIDIETAVSETRVELCEFEFEEGEECDNCDTPQSGGEKVYYQRMGYFVDEGYYWCEKCVIKIAEGNRRYSEEIDAEIAAGGAEL